MLPANHPLRRASWIWPGFFERLHNSYAQFRYDFKLGRVPARAPLFITADQQYMLYVNGQYAGRGPARGFQASWPFDEIDVAPLLRRGHNWLSVVAYNAGRSTFQYLHEGYAGLLCAAKWGAVEIATGRDWRYRPDPAHRVDTERLSMQLNFQEQIDCRLDDRAWITSPRPPRGWDFQPRMIRPFGSMPWHDLEPRGLANLGHELLAYERTVSAAAGPCAPGYEAWRNVAAGLHEEHQRMKWQPAPPGAPGRRRADGLVVTLPAAGKDRLSAATIDLGVLGLGTLIVEARGANDGDLLDLFCSEALRPDGAPIVNHPDQSCLAAMAVRLRLRAGVTRYEAFQPLGHRYVTAIARNTRQPITLKLALRHCVYPFAIKGAFATSDATCNDIYRISVRTQRVCAADSYLDTPWREQAQWWGDARVQGQNTFHIAGDPRLLVRGIRQIATQDVPNGLTYGHAPTMAHNCILPDFSIIWALTIWDHYYQTGDPSLFAEQWPRVQRVLNYFETEGLGRSGLLRYDPRYWLFLDWCNLYKDGTPTLLNQWYLLMLDRLAVLAGAARMPDAARQLRALYRRKRPLVLAKLFDAKAGLFRDGLTPDGRPVHVHSIHCQTLALLAGLHPEHHDTMLRKRLLPYVKGRHIPGALPSSYWVTYVYEALEQRGYGREVAQHIRAKWAPMIPFGGTWETFSGDIGSGSTSHAWAAHPIYHLTRTLGGVTQSDVAWRRITFAPAFDVPGVDHAKVTVPTPRGPIGAAWRRGKDGTDVNLTLPAGVEADVRLPGIRAAKVTGRCGWSVRA